MMNECVQICIYKRIQMAALKYRYIKDNRITTILLSAAAVFLICFAGSETVHAEQSLPEKGVPLMQSFTPMDYGHKGKIWDIDSAPNGIVYLASDKGLLEYDGLSWNHYIGSDGITRSVEVVSDSVIFTGSDRDFGVWHKNNYQDFEYTSLYPFKEDLNTINEEFWGTHNLNSSVFFVSSKNVYVYKDENLTKVPAPGRISKSFVVDGSLYFADETGGIFQFTDLASKLLFRLDDPGDIEIVSIYKQDDVHIIVTQNAGLIRYRNDEPETLNNSLSNTLKAANVFSFERISETHLVFGTILRGLYITDLEGNIIHYIDKNKGLLNNTILSIHYSRLGKLWYGMDYGISFLDLGNEFSFFYDHQGEFGTGQSAVLKDEIFYLGTNQGLYRIDWEDLNDRTAFNEFELISGTEGQVWTLQVIDGELLIGHDRGLFILRNGNAETVNNELGVWTLEPYNGYLMAGTYNGISIYQKIDNNWEYLKQMELIFGSCNQVLVEGDNTLWVNIPNFGVIRAALNQELYPVNRAIFESETFGSPDHYLQRNEDTVEVRTATNRFGYVQSSKSFEASPLEATKPRIRDLLPGGIQPVQLNETYEFYPVYNGFALRNLDLADEQRGHDPELTLRTVQAFNNDRRAEFYNGAEVPYPLNNLSLTAIVPNHDHVTYQYRIEGNGNWSAWSSENQFELVGLAHGDYSIMIRARVDGGMKLSETVNIRIRTPWHQTIYAYLGYVLIIALMFYLIYRWQKRSLIKLEQDLLTEQKNSLKEQEEKHRQQLREIEKRNMKIEHEQLKSKLKSKTLELATKAKENQEKNQLLQTLKEKVKQLEQHPESLKTRSAEMLKVINSYIESDDNTFELQMDEIHQEFIHKLKEDFPELTSNDLRLCAYIRMGFNSKETADLLNIKPSSIYISRSRLRKKLNLATDDDLYGYLNSI